MTGMDTSIATLWKSGNAFIRTARKPWRCSCRLREIHGETNEGKACWCETVIARGERYLESVDSAPAYQSGDRYCWACAEHQGIIRSEQPWEHRGGCLLPYLVKQSTDPRLCVCEGQPDKWYELVAS